MTTRNTANRKKRPELLSPAGSFEKMLFAFEYGADAVYVGAKSFSLREGAANFTVEELSNAARVAHEKEKKIYLAANIFFHDKHFAELRNFLEEIKDIPLDGILVSDLGALAYIREKYPKFPLHVSTQANTTNSMTARFYETLGVQRIVLAREMSLAEIRKIREATSAELETFIHGAMCISYSGRCLLSNYLTNASVYGKDEKMGDMKKIKTRDANLGDCSQSCRWNYTLLENSRPDERLPIEETENGTAILSSRDLNLSAHMQELLRAGIDSFKIEGRMKSVYYVSNITRVYRHALDRALEGKKPKPEFLEELNTVSHREYTTGFYFGENMALNPTKTSKYLKDFTFLGYVMEQAGKKTVQVRSMNQILAGRPLEVISPGFEDRVIRKYKLLRNGLETDKIQPNEEFILETFGGVKLKPFDILRRKDEKPEVQSV